MTTPQDAKQMHALIEAAEAVVARWYSPKWKDEPHTAEVINRLRDACAAIATQPAADERLEYLYQIACVKPFIAPIATKEKWLASIDAAIAEKEITNG